MAYSSNNSTAVNVTNFGAQGDGAYLDTNAIQSVINSLYSKGGGTVYLPRGRYLTSGYIHITGHNITLLGELNGTHIVTSPSGDFKKINISGASGCNLLNLNIDAGRVSNGRAEQYVGTINVYNASYFTIQNCFIEHTEGLGIALHGNTYCGEILNNSFDDFHIGIYSDSNDISGIAVNRINILNNVFSNSWGAYPEQNYFGAIKLQNNGFFDGSQIPARSYGHVIANNKISGSNQMGIELWGSISDSVVNNNYIEDSNFGISIANSSYDIAVTDNSIKRPTYVGIEVADSQNILVSNNTIDGSTGNFYNSPICYTQNGIIVNGINTKISRSNVIGNTIRDCSSKSIHIYNAESVNVIGNQSIQSGDGAGQNLYITNSNYVNASNNTLYNRTGTHFIFLNADNVFGITGVTVSNNDFIGSVSQWGILTYSPVGQQRNLLFENNRTYAVQYCGFGMFSADVTSYLSRDNYGQTGGLGYNIPDGQLPAGSTPYTTSDIENGFQYYGSSTWTIPASGITGNGVWLCVWSGGGGYQNNVRVNARNYFTQIANQYNAIELWANMVPYESFYFGHTLYSSPLSVINGNTYYVRAKTLSHESAANNSVWLQLSPLGSGASGQSFYFKYSQPNNLYSPYATYIEPTDTYNNANLYIDNSASINVSRAYKFSEGVLVGTACMAGIGSPISGRLDIYGSGILATGRLSQGTTLNNTKLALYDDSAGSVYGMGIQSNQFRFHVGSPSARFSFLNSGDGNELVTIKADGKMGINVINPNAALHVSGSVTLSGIATSTTANVGAATLPANPVGFVIINITGADFKIPYYNI